MKASVLLIACGFASAALGLAGSATAQPLHFEVEGIEEPEALTDALREDLGRPITFEEGRPLLRIVVAPGRQATLTYRAGDGAERTRTVVISRDREAAIVELTLVGSNLVRDQTEGLIADTSPLEAPEPGMVSSDEELIDEVHEATLSLAQAHPMNMGIAGYLGVQVQSSAAGSNARPFGAFGVSLSGTVNEMVSVGVTRVQFGFFGSSATGRDPEFGFSLEGTPFVELFAFLDPRVQVYGQLGVALQGRTQTSFLEGILQVAPFLGGGLRFWVFDTFSIGVELGAHLVLTDAYFTMGATLPQFSVPATIGVSLEWHINP